MKSSYVSVFDFYIHIFFNINILCISILTHNYAIIEQLLGICHVALKI